MDKRFVPKNCKKLNKTISNYKLTMGTRSGYKIKVQAKAGRKKIRVLEGYIDL